MLALTFLLLVAPPADMTTPASWIWYQERPAVEGSGQTRYFRRTLHLDGVPKLARLRARWDDGAEFWVNGQPAPRPIENGLGGPVYDLSTVLHAGANVLAFSVHNAGGPGGLILNGRVETAADQVLRIFSDTTWRTSQDGPDGWQQPGFDDSAWPLARIVGNAFAQPWFDHPSFDLEPFLEPDDRARYNAWIGALTNLPEDLAAEPPTAAKLGYRNGHCVLQLNEQAIPPLIYRGTVDPLTAHGRRQLALFRDAGCHVYCAYYPLGACMGKDAPPDFSRLDSIVKAYLSVDPEARVILILRLVPASWWMDEHPDDMVGYAAGDDFNTTDESGRVRRPSLASEPWRQDMGAIWEQCVEHLEKQAWGKRVIGYQPGYGIYTEWHYYGSWRQQAPDTGQAMTRWFRDWLHRKYEGQVEQLRAAWQNPTVTFETATVPGIPPRQAADALGLRDPAQRAWVIDYYRCQQELTTQRIEEFCGIAKEATGGRALTGVFYGYYEGVMPQTQGGHLELPQALGSKVIDYFAAPYDYSHRLMGDDGRSRAAIDAFPLAGKVHMIEADTRTYLHARNEYGRTDDAPSSIAAIRREVGTALAHHSALWWCDFGSDSTGGWYDEPQLIGQVKQLISAARRGLSKPTRDVAQVALIADPESCYYLGDNEAMRTHYKLTDQVTGALARTGAPFDFILLPELPQADLDRYKVLVFLDAVHVDPAMRKVVKRAVRGKSVVWLWAPGITDGQHFGPDLVRDLTGFGVTLPSPPLVAEQALVDANDPLTAGLPITASHELTVTGRQPIAAAVEPANWYNPRDAKTMQETYSAFEVTAVEHGIDWYVATTSSWSDVHLRVAAPAAEGLGLTVSGTEAVVGTSVRLVLKDADGAEFAAPMTPVTASPESHDWPLASFDRAPWYRGPAERPRLPLSGFKVVLNGLGGGRAGTLKLRRLSSLTGTVKSASRRAYVGAAGAQPCLVLEPDGAPVFGRSPSGEPLLAVRGPRGSRQLFSALAGLPLPVLTALLDEAGVHRYVTTPDVLLQADSNLLVLHSKVGGKVTVRLPKPETLVDALTGETVGHGSALELTLPAPGTTLLERR